MVVWEKIRACPRPALWIGACLSFLFASGCAHPSFRAYETTPIFGESREIVRVNDRLQFQFAYRGGTVTYRPDSGAEWTDGTTARSTETAAGRSRTPASLPNGCLIFACARAEEIRAGLLPGQTRSQVIGYKRLDGSGHAFVLYDQDGKTQARDDQGHAINMPGWKTRSPDEALALAESFQVRTHPAGASRPNRASFIGKF